MGEGSPISFKNYSECEASPLAHKLLGIQGIVEVFLGSDFITVTKQEDLDWYILKPSILGTIMEAFTNSLPIYIDSTEEGYAPSKKIVPPSDDPLVHQICELLDTRIRPAVAQDGGDITFEDFKEGIVYLRMKGACSGCPSSSATLKAGIENMLKYYVPEIKEVQQVYD
jgi:Fe-S cluster biogenesis protein NfuA